MSILHHVDLDVEERDAYVRYANARRRAEGEENGDEPCAPEEVALSISEARIAELEAAEEFILSVAEDGLGKRTSAYEYRITNRGGQGISNMELSRGRGKESRVVGAFPVQPTDQVVLVTDAGKLIRCPIDDVRIAGRATRGVRLFDVAEDERVVSVARLADEGEDEDVIAEAGAGAPGGE
jgi:DNA gyrase subunit A